MIRRSARIAALHAARIAALHAARAAALRVANTLPAAPRRSARIAALTAAKASTVCTSFHHNVNLTAPHLTLEEVKATYRFVQKDLASYNPHSDAYRSALTMIKNARECHTSRGQITWITALFRSMNEDPSLLHQVSTLPHIVQYKLLHFQAQIESYMKAFRTHVGPKTGHDHAIYDAWYKLQVEMNIMARYLKSMEA
jgi:hypothetical protein